MPLRHGCLKNRFLAIILYQRFYHNSLLSYLTDFIIQFGRKFLSHGFNILIYPKEVSSCSFSQVLTYRSPEYTVQASGREGMEWE